MAGCRRSSGTCRATSRPGGGSRWPWSASTPSRAAGPPTAKPSSWEIRLTGGGEADLFEVRHHPDLIAKIYKPKARTPERQQELLVTLRHPPQVLLNGSEHNSLTWPESLLTDNGSFFGFVMPRLGSSRHSTIYAIFHPQERPPGVSWRHLVHIARNLASVTAALQQEGYLVVDLNESNVLLNQKALITLVDCDSIQVTDPGNGQVHPCPVGRAHYTSPELKGKNLSTLTRRAEHDDFALAILIFQLLILGRHPYAGGAHQTIEENIAHGSSFVTKSSARPYLSSAKPMKISARPPVRGTYFTNSRTSST